ncbi:MAG: hypothetical protein WDW38_009827 [Sanguina aurantia]
MEQSEEDLIRRIPLLGVQRPEENFASPIDRRSDYYRQQARKGSSSAHQKPLRQPLMTIPNVLTFFRLLLVPVLLLLWDSQWTWAPLLCAVTFITAAVTDWADGYLARRMKIATVFGAFLDPVADKIMVATTLILLCISPPAPLSLSALAIPTTIIINREITMSALREWAASSGGAAQKAVKVNSLGKWKTALQMVSLSVLLLLRQPAHTWTLITGIDASEALLSHVSIASLWALWGGCLLGVWSLAIYMSNVWTHFLYPVMADKSHSQ